MGFVASALLRCVQLLVASAGMSEPHDPLEGAASEAAKVPGKDAVTIDEALTDYLREKLEEGRSPRHVKETCKYFRAAAAHAGWRTLLDVDERGARSYLSGLTNHHGEQASPKYYNNVKGYLTAVMAWAKKRKRVHANPIVEIEEHLDDRGEQVRPFTPAEFEGLLDFTRTRLNGAEAAAVYEFAAWTGLRRNELKLVRRCDFHLDVPEPFVELQPYQYKRGRARPKSEKIPLVSEDLVRRLRARLDPLKPGDRVFPTIPHPNQVKDDISRSTVLLPDGRRVPIENPDGLGRRLVLHSIRHMLGTNLAVAGVDVRRIQAILRHRDIRTTQRYIDAAQLPNAAALREVGRFYGGFRAA